MVELYKRVKAKMYPQHMTSKKIKRFFYNKASYLTILYVLTTVFSFTFSKMHDQQPLTASENGAVLSAEVPQNLESTPTPDPEKNILSVLLLGYGGAGHQGGYLSDAVMLAHFDFDQSKLTFISIPRDTWFQNAKINQLLKFNGNKLDSERIKAAASSITGLPINHAIAVDFVGFQRLIGQDLGSIVVDVPERFEDAWYPIRGEEVNPCDHSPEEIAQLTATLSGFALEKEFPCRYEHILFEQGPVKMEGGDALKYVRSRHSTSDFSRSQRQKAVLLGMKDKLFSLEALTNASHIYNTISKNVSTDLDPKSLKHVVPLLQNIPNLTINSIVLSTENVFNSSQSSAGAFILIPKNSFQDVANYIQTQLNN